jgi:hypothetical protein
MVDSNVDDANDVIRCWIVGLQPGWHRFSNGFRALTFHGSAIIVAPYLFKGGLPACLVLSREVTQGRVFRRSKPMVYSKGTFFCKASSPSCRLVILARLNNGQSSR